MAYTTAQQKLLSLFPRLSGTCSILGNVLILKSVLHDVSKKKMNTYHRLLIGMSFFDCLSSFALALSTLPMPKGTVGVWGALGTPATCMTQGFFVQTIVAVPIYNGSLAIYHLLIGRHWTEEGICIVEPLMHAFPLIVSVGTALLSFRLDLFHSADLWCWISPVSNQCRGHSGEGNGSDCITETSAWFYRLSLMYAPVWVMMIIAMFSLLCVYITVLQQEKDLDKFQCDGVSIRTLSSRVGWQAFWYSAAFYVAWVPPTITRLLQSTEIVAEDVMYPFLLAMAIGLPLQGFLNFLVYYRSKYMKFRRERPKATIIQALRKSLFFCPWALNSDLEDDLPDFDLSALAAAGRFCDKMESDSLATCCQESLFSGKF